MKSLIIAALCVLTAAMAYPADAHGGRTNAQG